MLLIAIAWIYVVAMVAAVQLTGADGSALHAAATLLFWGALPLAIVGYLALAPARRRRRQQADPLSAALDPDGGRHPPGGAVAPEREEP